MFDASRSWTGEWKPLRASLLLGTAAILAGCASAPSEPESTPSLHKPQSKAARGLYHKGDGPPQRVPAGLEALPELEPQVEESLSRTSRPYHVLGRRYVPLTGDPEFRQRGKASWYGKKFHGRRTASGEPYDMFLFTAAHPTLPLPSYVRVRHLGNGRELIVRVNDRGPFHDGRIIDLSYLAAQRLGLLGAGSAEVEIERLTHEAIRSGAWREGGKAQALATGQ